MFKDKEISKVLNLKKQLENEELVFEKLSKIIDPHNQFSGPLLYSKPFQYLIFEVLEL